MVFNNLPGIEIRAQASSSPVFLAHLHLSYTTLGQNFPGSLFSHTYAGTVHSKLTFLGDVLI